MILAERLDNFGAELKQSVDEAIDKQLNKFHDSIQFDFDQIREPAIRKQTRIERVEREKKNQTQKM